eukprot:3645151-Rhodomonas_salina.6
MDADRHARNTSVATLLTAKSRNQREQTVIAPESQNVEQTVDGSGISYSGFARVSTDLLDLWRNHRPS